MEIGIQYQKELELEKIKEAGFQHLEVPYNLLDVVDADVLGIILKADDISGEILQEAISKAEQSGASYIVLDTQGMRDASGLCAAVTSIVEQIRSSTVEIYIENGYAEMKDGSYANCIFSETDTLRQMIEEYNALVGSERFGICINVGYTNLVNRNIRVMIEELGEYVKLVHANDNDAIHNLHQMPCTFSKSREDATSTDWYHIIGALIQRNYTGWLVFDAIGLFKRIPLALQSTMLDFLMKLGQEWEERFHIEELLNQPDKVLILFGAGKMARNYLMAWGEKYPPVFLVDNNSKIWGEERYGYPVKSPEDILTITPEKRNVWICNLYYDSIGEQLQKMGIEYQCYYDWYYLMEGA